MFPGVIPGHLTMPCWVVNAVDTWIFCTCLVSSIEPHCWEKPLTVSGWVRVIFVCFICVRLLV